MTALQYRKALETLGLSQQAAADLIGFGRRTSQGYALGEYPVHSAVAILLRLLLKGTITIRDVEHSK